MAFFSLQFCLDMFHEVSDKGPLTAHEIEIKNRLDLAIKYKLSSRISSEITEFLWSQQLSEFFSSKDISEHFDFDELKAPFGMFVYECSRTQDDRSTSYCLVDVSNTGRLSCQKKLIKPDLQCIIFRKDGLAAFPVISPLADKLVDAPAYFRKLMSSSHQLSESIALLMVQEIFNEPLRSAFGFTDSSIQKIFFGSSLEDITFLLQSSFYESIKQPYRNLVRLAPQDRKGIINLFDNENTTLLFSYLQKLVTLHPNLRDYFSRHKQDTARFFVGKGPFPTALQNGDYIFAPVEDDGHTFQQLFYIASIEKNILLATNRLGQLPGEENERKFEAILPLREKLNQLANKVITEGNQSFLELPLSEVIKIVPFQSSIEDLLCEMSGKFEAVNIFNDIYAIAISSEFSDFLNKLRVSFDLDSIKLEQAEFEKFAMLLWHICNFIKSFGQKILEIIPQEDLQEFKSCKSLKFPDLFKKYSPDVGYVYAILIGIFFHMSSDDFLGTAADSSSLFFRLLALFSGVALEQNVLSVIANADQPKPTEPDIKKMKEYFSAFYVSGLSFVCGATVSESYLSRIATINQVKGTGEVTSAVFDLLNSKISKPRETPSPVV
ncbi:MAG: hypothetical protein V4591_07620 [Bdellovibrionota bacterium]